MTMDAPVTREPVVDDGPLVDWRAVFRGALLGLCVLIAASVLEAILDHNIDRFQDSGWIYPLFVAILFGYALGGWQAGRTVPDGALTNGTLAGVGAFVLWVPVRIGIWLVRDEHKGLFTGHSPALRPGQLFGHLLIAAALGMLGGFIGSRTAAPDRGTTTS
ncbi:MAG: hypothetical protein QOF40_136 [Actinomycetota bacterium]|nr:hypothetical protein [Actinomycetota bacterium]